MGIPTRSANADRLVTVLSGEVDTVNARLDHNLELVTGLSGEIDMLKNDNEYTSQKYKPETQQYVDELVKTIYDDAVANNKNSYFPLAYGVGSEKIGGDVVISF